LEKLVVGLGNPGEEYRDALDTPFDHSPDRTLHSLWIMAGRTKQDFVAVLDSNRLEYLHDFREEWVGYVGDD
jgi:hypothetical protein